MELSNIDTSTLTQPDNELKNLVASIESDIDDIVESAGIPLEKIQEELTNLDLTHQWRDGWLLFTDGNLIGKTPVYTVMASLDGICYERLFQDCYWVDAELMSLELKPFGLSLDGESDEDE